MSKCKCAYCWQELQLAQFAQDLFLSLVSKFKMPKGEFFGQFAQAPWINLHKNNLNFRDRQFRRSSLWEFLFQDFGSFYFGIFSW
jgi:hypothetical protein